MMRQSSAASAASAPAANTPDTRLYGRRLLVARGVWGLVAVIDLGVLLVGVPAYAAQLARFCTDPTRVKCGYEQLVPAQQAALQHFGISLTGYAIYALAVDVVLTLLFVGVGALIVWHKSAERMGLFVSLLLITYGSFGTELVHLNPLGTTSVVVFFAFPIALLEWPALGMLFYTFPDGRFVPSWSWQLALLYVIQFSFYVLP